LGLLLFLLEALLLLLSRALLAYYIHFNGKEVESMFKEKFIVFGTSVMGAVGAVATIPMVAIAADPPTPVDISGVFSSVTTEATTAVTTVLPYAAVILGAILGIRIGLKVFKAVVGRG
jgi:hypothetical protein